MAQEIQDCCINLKDGSRPGQPKTVSTNCIIDAVVGLIKGDARLTYSLFFTVKNIAHSVGISSGSAHSYNLEVCARYASIA